MNRTHAQAKIYDKIEDIALSIILGELHKAGGLENKPRKKTKVVKGEGQRRLENLLNSNHEARIRAAFRMNRETFYRLRDSLFQNTNLRRSKHISLEMKIAIFLAITTRPASQRDVEDL